MVHAEVGVDSQRSASRAPETRFDLGGLLPATMAAFGVTVLIARKGRESTWAYLLFGGAATMLVDVLVPHVPATLIFGQYTPGMVRAVCIHVPVMSFLLYRAARDGWVAGTRAAWYGLLVPIVIGGLILGVFALA